MRIQASRSGYMTFLLQLTVPFSTFLILYLQKKNNKKTVLYLQLIMQKWHIENSKNNNGDITSAAPRHFQRAVTELDSVNHARSFIYRPIFYIFYVFERIYLLYPWTNKLIDWYFSTELITRFRWHDNGPGQKLSNRLFNWTEIDQLNQQYIHLFTVYYG